MLFSRKNESLLINVLNLDHTDCSDVDQHKQRSLQCNQQNAAVWCFETNASEFSSETNLIFLLHITTHDLYLQM